MKRLTSIVIVAAMLSVSFAVGISVPASAGTSYIEDMSVPWGINFQPQDIAWNEDGNTAVVVGYDMSATANSYVYYKLNDTWFQLVNMWDNSQNLTGVDYDPNFDNFWIAGTYGAVGSGVYAWSPSSGNNKLTMPKSITFSFTDIAVDQWGNPLAVGLSQSNFYYLDFFNAAGVWTPIVPSGSSLGNKLIRSVDYSYIDHCFYAVGEAIIARGAIGNSGATIWYTDSAMAAPLTGSNYCYEDVSGFSSGIEYLASIDWNQNYDYGLAVGSGIYKIWPGGAGGVVIQDPMIIDGFPVHYNDVSWDPSATGGYESAAIVGVQYNTTFGGYRAYYWNYQPFDQGLLRGEVISNTPDAWCVGYKPAASPKFPFIPLGGGGVIINAAMQDQTTRITANAVFPKLYWIGFNDTTTASRLDQQVPLNSWYNFTLETNYSEGWNFCEVYVEAWYDWGATGGASNFPAQNDANRDLAFMLNYSAVTGEYGVLYPNTPWDLEVMNGTNAIVTGLGPGPEDHRIVQLPIYLGPQIRNATGDGFLAGGTYDDLKNIALNDAWSWDFEVTVRDARNPTALANMSAEFGIEEMVQISVSGNPSGNAPPGTADNLLNDPSIITYTANTDYWVNVSIPNLYLNGNPAATDWIPCSDVSVQNMCPNATIGNSDISAMTGMPIAEDQNVYVWGQPLTPIGAPSNGTNATGPYITNFNGPIWGEDTFTTLNWWVTVQAGTPEGIYWAIITITIES